MEFLKQTAKQVTVLVKTDCIPYYTGCAPKFSESYKQRLVYLFCTL
jgi:hypothetical protein